MTDTPRKGAKSIKDIPKDTMVQINCGEIETANLVEWLAVDQRILLKNLLEQTGRSIYLEPILSDIEKLKKQTVNTINEAIGTRILVLSTEKNDREILTVIQNHKSDVVRCWAAYAVGKNTQGSLERIFEQMQHFAADDHFGVREIAWMAIRSVISKNLGHSIEVLSKWAENKNENIRRFASEATRPRGVWCAHIEELKQSPDKGLPILKPLKADSSKYVRDSVGNWLNDASKTKPEFVRNLCEQWKNESPTKETAYIIKKAMRTIDKKTIEKI